MNVTEQYKSDHAEALIENRRYHYRKLQQAMIATLAALTPLTCRATFNGLVNNVKAV